MFIAFLISFTFGLLDGLGLAMFLPLLKLAGGDNELTPSEAGDYGHFISWFNEIGIFFTIETILFLLVFFFFLKGVFKFFAHFYFVKVQQFFVAQLRLNLSKALKDFSYKKFISLDVGRIQNTLTGEIGRVSTAVQSYYKSFEQMILVLVYAGFAISIDFRFASMALAGGALSNLAYRSIFSRTKSASYEVSTQGNLFQNRIIQFINNFKYLKASGSSELFYKQIKESVFFLERLQVHIGKLRATLFASKEPLIIAVMAVLIILQIRVFEASLAPILISLLFFYRALGAFMMVQNQWNTYLGVSGSLRNTTELLTDLKKGQEKLKEGKVPEHIPFIKLDNVSFSFKAKDWILQNLNLTINQNETIAIVGESGSGKSTLINIICGLLKPSQGKVLLESKDLGQTNLKDFQRRIGYITQEPVIFNDTVFNNITLWQDPTPENMARFRAALQEASIEEFVNSLPAKEKHLLENSGANLSGGQKQRISIARELYKKVQLLVLDEATSALDSQTERIIQENIDSLKGRYTVVIVAHRLSTVKNANRIVVLNKGLIEDVGTFEELMRRTPRFRKMVELQEL